MPPIARLASNAARQIHHAEVLALTRHHHPGKALRRPGSVLRRDTVLDVAERDYVWTDQGVASARTSGLSVAEVIQALYAPPGLRYERRVGELLLIVMGMAETGRVVAVLCDRVEDTATYEIIGARALAGHDLDEWRRHIR